MVRVLIKSESKFPVNKKIIKQSVVDTLNANKVKGDVEVSVAVVGKKEMQSFSDNYLHDNKLHEVFSFSLANDDKFKIPDKVLRLGDVVLCWPEVLLAAERDGVMVDDEIYSLTAHSVEHLLGKHHE